MYVIVWRFRVKPGREAEFERAYGPKGDWVKLFSAEKSYRGTDLVRDPKEKNVYITIDRWASQDAYDAFRAWQRTAYDALDRRCKTLNDEETRIAVGETVDGATKS